MSQESHEPPPVVHLVQPEQDPAAVWAHASEVRISLPTEDQVRHADGVFTHHPSEADQAIGLLTMLSSVHLLHDLAVETFHEPEEEKVRKKKNGGSPVE